MKIFLMPLMWIFLLLLFSCTTKETTTSQTLFKIIDSHIKKHPKMQVEDVYKLIYQAAMGPAHFIKTREDSYKRLFNEVKNLKKTFIISSEELCEEISPIGEVVRINIRPFIRKGGSVTLLNDEFYLSSRKIKKSKKNLIKYISLVGKILPKKEWPFSKKKWEMLVSDLKVQNYPAIHHSKRYRKLYSPSYRVVMECQKIKTSLDKKPD